MLKGCKTLSRLDFAHLAATRAAALPHLPLSVRQSGLRIFRIEVWPARIPTVGRYALWRLQPKTLTGLGSTYDGPRLCPPPA